MIRLAHTDADGIRTYHDRHHRIAALVGHADAILARYRRGYRDFDLYGSPAQRDGLFLLARPGITLSNVGVAEGEMLLPSTARWEPLTEAELAEHVADG